MYSKRPTYVMVFAPLAAIFATLTTVPGARAQSAAETAAGEASNQSLTHSARWHELSLREKRQWGEVFGEKGAEVRASQRGYKPLMKHTLRTYRHGYDQLWYDPEKERNRGD